MIKLNLLPPWKKEEIKWEKINRVLTVNEAVVAIELAVFIAVLLLAQFCLSSELSRVDKLVIQKQQEKEIKEVRAKSGKSLLVFYPLDWTADKGLIKDVPLVGWGIVFPEIENEEKVEFAARPLVVDSEDTQIDDDNDIENGDD